MAPGGLLLTRPSAGDGATPMLPKKGRRGMTIPGAKELAVMRCRSRAMIVTDANDGSQFWGKKAAAPVVSVVEWQIRRQNFHFERIARFGALDEYGARQNVPARPPPFAR